MKRIKTTIWIGVLLILALATSNKIEAQETIEKSFDKKSKIKVELAIGSCKINRSGNDQIHVRVEYSFNKEYYSALFEPKENSLLLKEKFDDDFNNNKDGWSKWTISVPQNMRVDFNTGTGDLEVDGLIIEIDGNTGTGDIILSKTDGEFDLNSGTGDIIVKESKGDFNLNSGTGDVKVVKTIGDFNLNSGTGDVLANKIKIKTKAKFNSGTGDAEVNSPSGEGYELYINSGTGDAILDMEGRKIEGYFVFSCNKFSGDIVSPIEFDTENIIKKSKKVKLVKTFKIGSKVNKYFISTGIGTAELKK